MQPHHDYYVFIWINYNLVSGNYKIFVVWLHTRILCNYTNMYADKERRGKKRREEGEEIQKVYQQIFLSKILNDLKH